MLVLCVWEWVTGLIYSGLCGRKEWNIGLQHTVRYLCQSESELYLFLEIFIMSSGFCGPGSSVGIVTGYGLDGTGIESQWGARFSAPVQTGPVAHPASCAMGTGSFPGVKSGRGVMLTPHPLLVPWSWKSRAIPLLPLWAVRPVQSLSACTRVHFLPLVFDTQDRCSVLGPNKEWPKHQRTRGILLKLTYS